MSLALSLIAVEAFGQNLRLEHLPPKAQEFVRKSNASLAFIGFARGGQDALFSANDGLVRQVNLTAGTLERVVGASPRRDEDIRNWAQKQPIEPFTNLFQMRRVSTSPNGLYYSYTDATGVAWVVDARTGKALFTSQTSILNGGTWWTAGGEFMAMPGIYVLPQDAEKREHVFSLVAFDPSNLSARLARPWSVSEDNAPEAFKTPRKRWMNGTWWYEIPGGSFSVSNNRVEPPILGYFLSEEDSSLDRAIELPFKITGPEEVQINRNSTQILFNDRKGKKVWLTSLEKEKPQVIAEYSPVTEPGFDGTQAYLQWLGTDQFLLTSVSAKKVGARIEYKLSDWSLRKLDAPTIPISTQAPKWASRTMSFSPDGKWVIDSMYIREVATGKGWLIESNFAIHPSEVNVKVTPLAPM